MENLLGDEFYNGISFFGSFDKEDEKYEVWCYGMIRYKDGFGTARLMGFARKYNSSTEIFEPSNDIEHEFSY